jgi:hexosaminidase
MSNRFFTVLFLFMACFSTINAQAGPGFDEKNLHITWELVSNNNGVTDQAFTVFTLINDSKKPFPASGWTIYFTSNREIEAAQTMNGVSIGRVNGDVYKIVPGSTFTGIPAKSSMRIEYFSEGMIFNYTATPAGLYIVWDNAPETGHSISNFTIIPLKNTVPDMVTPEKVYKQNSTIQDIPADRLPKIFPTPVTSHFRSGAFVLNGDVTILSDQLFQQEAEYLATALSGMLGKKISVDYGAEPAKIVLQKGPQPEEGYALSVSEDQITISAGSGAGIFYGIQSLWSLMPPEAWNGIQKQINVPLAEVQDAPRFGYRSLMLDVARNFKSKKDIFHVLDLMALYKLNVFHFHITEDEGWRIEIPGLPELTEVGARRGHSADGKKMLPASYGAGPEPGKSLGTGFYTRNDFIEILRYAKVRHIQVIPEIESPGHSRAAIKSMEARYERYMKAGNPAEAEKYLLHDLNDKSVYSSAQQWTDNVMCVALPSVYQFVEKVVDELVSMYKEAGAPLTTIHLGGDEVPTGVWEKSPVCWQFIKDNPMVKSIDDLWVYYYGRVNNILKSKGLFLSAWEEAGLRKTKRDDQKVFIVNPRAANDGYQLHVWNNVVGWGNEDLPYKLANAGYNVVLSPVSNNYLDLAYLKHPDEPGLYWGGFQDLDKPFYFNPFDYYKTTVEGPNGYPINPAAFANKERLTDFGKTNIVGIQGLLWAENLRSVDQMEYLLLPKILGVAERAWAKEPDWATEKYKVEFDRMYARDWSQFVNMIGKRELPRLDYFSGGYKYRIPWAGAVAENGLVKVNLQLPGLVIRYTTDGTEPTVQSRLYKEPIAEKGVIKIKVFDGKGRGSLTTTIENK